MTRKLPMEPDDRLKTEAAMKIYLKFTYDLRTNISHKTNSPSAITGLTDGAAVLWKQVDNGLQPLDASK